MFWKQIVGRVTAAASAAFLVCSAPAVAGGFFIVAELPTAERPASDAALILSVFGCHPLETMSAKAEGIVDGKRVSLPLTLESRGDGSYSLKRSWPEKGAWVISVYAVSAEPVTAGGKTFRIRDAALFPVGSEGVLTVLAPNDARQKVRPLTIAGQPTRMMLEGQRLSVVPSQKTQEIDNALRAAVQDLEQLSAPPVATR